LDIITLHIIHKIHKIHYHFQATWEASKLESNVPIIGT
jgi:hypothetical protein